MISTLRNAWKIPDLRKKMLYTLLMIVIFRLGTFIPVPGLNASVLQSLVEGGNNSLFGLLDAFSGGSFSNATIFAMSITPYINSSIILQLLTVAIPALERLSKEGEEGRRVIGKWTRIVTVILAFVKDRGMVFHLIVMLAIAVYAFTKITLATIKWIKARKSKSVKLITLRNISFADAFVSIFSLQRSMLVSFEGMTEMEIRIMNVATGSAVCIIVFLLGLNLLHTKNTL